MVYYRKYRPQTIGELDNQKLRETLCAVLSGKSLPHAFLFTGPKGLGKTSTARILAKAINCEKRNQELGIRNKGKELNKKEEKSPNSSFIIPNSLVEPCNQCNQCISITNGNNIDILEIDAASNRGIDEIRDLREKIRLSPVAATKKVYIIDEVHMLTTEAFNALLKTLEEPPSHAVFMLCTTEAHKVPETILSRCFHIQFTKATHEELISSFKRILQGEALQIEDEALSLVANLSEGGFRDGAKILEEVMLLSQGKKITKELVENKFQISNIQSQISNMLDILQKKDTKVGLQLVGKLVEQGIDIKYFIEQLINALHEQLLKEIGIDSKNFQFPISNIKFQMQEIKKLVELLTKAHQELKYAVIPQLPLEMVIVEWSMLADQTTECRRQSTDDRIQKTENTENLSSDLSAIRNPSSVLNSPIISSKFPSDTTFLSQLIDKVKLQNQAVAGVLRGCKVKNIDDKSFAIETPYKFHKDKLSEQKTLELIEKISSEITGNSVTISVLLKSV